MINKYRNLLFLFIIIIILILILNYYKFTNKELFENKVIICMPTNKIGNILRNASTLWILSKVKSFNFKVDTQKALEAEKNILEKFLKPEFFNSIPEYKEIKEGDIYEINELNNYATNWNFLVEKNIVDNIDDIFDKIENIGISSIYAGKLKTMDIPTYMVFKYNFYRDVFIFPQYFIDLCKKWIDVNKDINIGFHIRYTDNLNDREKQKINTPIEVYIDKIKEINEFNNTNNTNNKILICTDNPNKIKELLTPLNINYVLPPIYFKDKEQPLFEMYLLSSLKHFYGSCSSSLSYEGFYFNYYNKDKKFYEYNLFDKKWIEYGIEY